MTQQQQPQQMQLAQFSVDGKALPFEFPRCGRIITQHPWPPPEAKPEEKEQGLLWMQGENHPLINGHIVIRMYVVPGVCVEVYSIERPKDGQKGEVRGGVRQTIPWPFVRLAEEVMDLQTFVSEIVSAEKGEDEPEEPEEPAPGATVGAPMAAAVGNGAAS